MKNYRLYLCAAVFIGLTVLKLLFPQHAASLREQVLKVIGHDGDYVRMIETMGGTFSEGGLKKGLLEVLDRRDWTDGEREIQAMDMSPFRADFDALLKSVTGGGGAAAASVLPAQAEEQPEAVSAFLKLQREYEEQGYALPDNVRTDMPRLPFDYVRPVEGADSSGFGYRLHPIQGGVKFHFGTDLAADSGAAVLAFADGTVSAAGTNPGYGNYMILEHEGGYSTVYAHLSAFTAGEGDQVSRGEEIGKVGQTGNATGPHLHFELLLDGRYINPEYYL